MGSLVPVDRDQRMLDGTGYKIKMKVFGLRWVRGLFSSFVR